ncbi:hypothetical protein [Streptomonospora litoralis]|uniref:Uncharacterized protein n=1 Tax=Streptomonospora litoralis TaxID=2498135 RepID=A0A4P6QB83_9ACTN|nr:hypothetical protein [Streptomonospora litoralis]QBI56824.1 hypothetical protein EKD16_25420 [Streptomonospora litoralis]
MVTALEAELARIEEEGDTSRAVAAVRALTRGHQPLDTPQGRVCHISHAEGDHVEWPCWEYQAAMEALGMYL